MKNKSAILFMLLLAAPLLLCAGVTSSGVKFGYAPVRGLRIYYEIRGTPHPHQAPLILLHGGDPAIQTSFGSVIEELAKNRWVIAFEQAGHGHTADRPTPFSFEASADDANGLMDILKIRKADFFGYSNGGSIAMQMAIRHPSRVNKLIVASAMYKRDGLKPEFWDSMKTATLESMPTTYRDIYVKTSPHPKKLKSYFEKSVARMLNFKDWSPDALRKIQAPTLILIGDADIVFPEHAKEMAQLIPNSRVEILPGLDHMALAQNWPVALIQEFLDKP